MKLVAIGLALALSGVTTPALAASSCPPEVAEAKTALTKAQASLKQATAARGQDVQAPRAAAGARGQDVQAPRGQDVQAPRGQDVQAPRGQDVQAPRDQNVQAPRGQDVQAPRAQSVSKAASLVREAEQACKQGKTTLASKKAQEALALLK